MYPYDAAFFLLYIRMTVFHSFVAAATRVTHIPLDWMIFLLHLISIFCFAGVPGAHSQVYCGRSCAVGGSGARCSAADAAVTGTALFLVDQHLAPRTLASAFLLFATVAVLNGQPRALLWVVLAGLFHPTITAYGIVHLVVLGMPPIGTRPALFLPALPMSEPANPIWREMMSHRHFQYPLRWTWYEWLGWVARLYC